MTLDGLDSSSDSDSVVDDIFFLRPASVASHDSEEQSSSVLSPLHSAKQTGSTVRAAQRGITRRPRHFSESSLLEEMETECYVARRSSMRRRFRSLSDNDGMTVSEESSKPGKLNV